MKDEEAIKEIVKVLQQIDLDELLKEVAQRK